MIVSCLRNLSGLKQDTIGIEIKAQGESNV